MRVFHGEATSQHWQDMDMNWRKRFSADMLPELDISFPNGSREFGHYCLIRSRPMSKHMGVNL